MACAVRLLRAARAVLVVCDGVGRVEPADGGGAVRVAGAALRREQADPAVVIRLGVMAFELRCRPYRWAFMPLAQFR